MRHFRTEPPSFPEVEPDQLLSVRQAETWQVICGDTGHYRVGVYSPDLASREEVTELEQHDCPEFFILLSGRVTLVLADGAGGMKELALQPGRPVMISAPHNGYCPDGPHTGRALVVERDAFLTEYRDVGEW